MSLRMRWSNPGASMQQAARALLRPLSSATDRLGIYFYVGLAIVVIAVGAYAIMAGKTGTMKNKALDLVMKSRIHAPLADSQIVVLDIDEAALAAMAKDYGRWPWPRSIMGELIDGLGAQNPKAIVFDIAFSDPDVFNRDADKYFRDAASRNRLTYFPMIRLVPDNDARSALRVNQLPGVTPLADDAPQDATIAVVLPFFADVLDDKRLGTNNILADDDGIVRTYPVYADEYGWRVGSLPANVVQSLGFEVPHSTDVLLNWRGKPPSYRHISFHEVYFDLQRKNPVRPKDEFTDKIVIIGSTAPALFDYKSTAMTKGHAGVEILATALDNLKNADTLRELPPWVYVLITALAVSLLALAFVYSVDQRVITLSFTVLQTGFLVVSYVFLNVSTLFVDLTAPFAFCLAYFTIARINGTLSSYRRSGHPLFSTLLDVGSECRVILVECRVHQRERNARLRLGAELKKIAGRSRFGVVAPPFYNSVPLLRAFMYDSLLFYWIVPRGREREALNDVLDMLQRMRTRIDHVTKRWAKAPVTVVSHTTAFKIDGAHAWRNIGQRAFAELLSAEMPAPGATLQFCVTDELRRWCREEKVAVPPAVADAGVA